MQKPKCHILVCCSFRVSGEMKGSCHRKGAMQLIPYIETELSDRGINDVVISATGCMKLCDNGPIMVIYPQGFWYGKVDEKAVIDILDALEQGKAAQGHLLENKN